ncbi:Cytochrome c-type biogenesis protein DsbD, protein-disulfide reductase [hydrothermal vent metagenome]|uniref:Cytochrome c-type biogenesis protein DsbD, protein-disulfide reductase n=1 Tax=hydrothermal vent metagenome TaxID=652676 RepID=A0A3B0YKV4_9ZZZZ
MKNWIFLLLASCMSLAQAGLFNDDELLPVEEAFPFSAQIEGDHIRAVWQVSDGYYLYKSKIHFTTDSTGILLGTPELPAGKVKNDEFFGEIETYRHQVVVNIPLTRATGSADTLELKVNSQGCADIGVCYPPQTQIASLLLTNAIPPNPASKQPAALKSLNDLGMSLGFGGQDELLPADEAFQPDLLISDANTLTANWLIADGYYLYRHKFEFSLDDGNGVTLLPATFPEGKHKTDEIFGDIEAYYHKVSATLPLQRTSREQTPITLTLKYQGCADRGVCYPPMSRTFELILPALAADAELAVVSPAETLNDVDRFAQALSKGSLLSVVIAALGFGLLLAFTACMYPMIPILSSIIVGQGEKATVARSLLLSLIYVEALAITFAVIGAIVGSFSGAIGIQALFQKPIFLIPFSVLFVALALSMFGFFALQLPAGLQSRLSNISNRQRGGTFIGVFIMGSLSALIIGPCGGPILIAALGYAASAGPVNGAIAMFALGNGMGLPLLLVGASGGKLLPKAGDWMNVVKAVAGVILLAVAISFLSRMPHIFSPMLIMLMWAVLLIISGIFMGALEPLPIESTGWRKFWKGTGLVILLYGTAVLAGGLSGAHDVTNPLHGSKLLAASSPAGGVSMTAVGGTHRAAKSFTRIKTVDDLHNAIAAANTAGKPVMLDFYADWCTYCIQYEQYVFPVPSVQQALSDYVLLQADVTAVDADDKALMKNVGVVLPPAILFFDRHGKEQRAFRVVGNMKAPAFADHVNRASGR